MSKRLFTVLTAGALVLSLLVPAMAATSADEEIVNRALNQVTALYTDAYTISDASAEFMEKTQDESGNTIYIICASFKRTLKATNAMELPAIQSMIEAKNSLTDPNEIKAAEAYISSWIADIEKNYIGVAQDTNVTLRLSIPATLPASTSVQDAVTKDMIEVESAFEDDKYMSLAGIAPRNVEEQQAAGIALVKSLVSNVESISDRAETPHNERILNYDRVKAQKYARKWSCTEAIIGDHSTCHNPDYKYFEGDEGTDCTNFVSQCLHEGGLDQDDVWYTYSAPWTTTGNYGNGIRQYVTDNDLFFKTSDITKAFAGSIVNDLKSDGSNAGHVGLIDQNDLNTITLCAHDSCRLSYPVSKWDEVNFFVPYYDSESDQWIEP